MTIVNYPKGGAAEITLLGCRPNEYALQIQAVIDAIQDNPGISERKAEWLGNFATQLLLRDYDNIIQQNK